jgi:uncharacterized damage-inducible protein DinB
MPLFVPPVTDERTALLAFLEQQRQGLRAAVWGLSDAEAGQTPTASGNSLGGLIKHVTRTERRWVQVSLAGRSRPELWPITDWASDFVFEPGDSLDALLDDYAVAAAETEQIVMAIDDLGAPCALDEAAEWNGRWILLHMIEETARHAGHADLIRETLDGASAGKLLRQMEEAQAVQ